PTDTNLGCNPASVPTCDSSITASNECGSVPVTCSPSDSVVGCMHTRTLTYTATDTCSKLSNTCVQHITWRVVTKPAFDNCPTDVTLPNCNPMSIPGCDPSVTARNECGAVPVTCGTPSDSIVGCLGTRTITYTATDPCSGLSNMCVQHIMWTVDSG